MSLCFATASVRHALHWNQETDLAGAREVRQFGQREADAILVALRLDARLCLDRVESISAGAPSQEVRAWTVSNSRTRGVEKHEQ